MPIEINGQQPSLPTGINESPRKPDAAGQSGAGLQSPAGGAASDDSVNLTNTASMLKKMQSTLSTVPVVDQQRVQGIRQAILNGTYDVNPSRVADKLMSFEGKLRNG